MSLNCIVFVVAHSARESPVAWEGQSLESVDNNQPSHPVGSESQSSPSQNQAQKRWDAEEEPKKELPPPPPPEDEESNSGV